VVCRIFRKSGSGPQNGAQYGAPFMEEEWEQEVNGADETMAAVMQVEKDNELHDEYVQINDLLPVSALIVMLLWNFVAEGNCY
jgi:hypothetical protein